MPSPYGAPILVAGAEEARLLERIRLGDRDQAGFNEAWLQQLIHRHPSCLPIEEIEPAFSQVVAVCREMPTKHGPIDNFLMTPDGDLVIVEAKLWRNPEARRSVVAQALDYASCLFDMEYAELEATALKGRFGDRLAPKRLYDLFTDSEAKEEASFIDAVNTNLRKGRALILVVGDGIRTEAVRLTSLLQSHAGARFTFALVELAVFRVPGAEQTMVCPRVLAQTQMIERGVVQIEDGRIRIAAPREPVAVDRTEAKPKSISADQFYEAIAEIDATLPARLRALIVTLEPIGVYAEFGRALNLKWDPPEGKPFNLGYIDRVGRVRTDAANWFGRHELGHRYNESLAAALGFGINKEAKPGWHLATPAGGYPRIDQINFDKWQEVIESFIATLREP